MRVTRRRGIAHTWDFLHFSSRSFLQFFFLLLQHRAKYKREEDSCYHIGIYPTMLLLSSNLFVQLDVLKILGTVFFYSQKFARKQRRRGDEKRDRGTNRSRDYSPIETLTLNYNDGLSVLHNGTPDAQISTFNCFLIIIINRARSRASWWWWWWCALILGADFIIVSLDRWPTRILGGRASCHYESY